MFAIPSGLSDWELPIRVQRPSKERHEAEDGQRAEESSVQWLDPTIGVAGKLTEGLTDFSLKDGIFH